MCRGYNFKHLDEGIDVGKFANILSRAINLIEVKVAHNSNDIGSSF
jgi:hypothetical protein